jgi:hypothetical protein
MGVVQVVDGSKEAFLDGSGCRKIGFSVVDRNIEQKMKIRNGS